MQSTTCSTGIPAVGETRWGTHFCQFYRTKQDLLDTLIPYFVHGLRNNEFCMCVAATTLSVDEICEHMSQAMPDFHRFRDQQQIELWSYQDWYLGRSLDDVLANWMEKYQQAIDRGFNGMRLSGDTKWLDRSGWNDFVSYENRVNESFGKFRLLGLCTYSLDKCAGDVVLDVVRTHQFALSRRRGAWEILEGSALKSVREDLRRVQETRQRVVERTSTLQTAIEERDRFLAMLGHELRNPLAAIRTAAELLKDSKLPDAELPKLRAMIVRQSDHLGRIVDDLLDVARITSGRLRLDKQTINFADLVLTVVNDFQSVARRSNVNLEVTCEQNPVPVEGNATRLMQVVSNLIDNAVKFSNPGGAVSIRVGSSSQMREATLEVSDEGTGIDSDLLGRLFDPFAQADRSLDRSRGGLGLGLAVVRGLVELHGGTVSASSAGEGQGATFVVRLPLSVNSLSITADGNHLQTTEQALRVLVIEDNIDAAESMRLMLQLEGHTVAVSHTGSQGLVKALLFRPHVVLCDIGLPNGMSGYAVAQRMRAEPTLKNVQLIAISGYGQDEDVRRATESGFDCHITKPVQPDRLRNLLNAISQKV